MIQHKNNNNHKSLRSYLFDIYKTIILSDKSWPRGCNIKCFKDNFFCCFYYDALLRMFRIQLVRFRFVWVGVFNTPQLQVTVTATWKKK